MGSFKKRFSVHESGLKLLNNGKVLDLDIKCSSPLANHCFENNHNFTIDLLKAINVINKGSKLDTLEALEIKKAICEGKQIVNDTDLKKSHISDNLIPLLVFYCE